MLAFHSDVKVKKAILKQLRAHAAADEIVKGRYWDGGKGCAVGCTVHSGDHAEYEPRFGIPQVLARLEDTIFEGLPNDRSKDWPVQFMSAIKTGADLSKVGWKFLHWLLIDEEVNSGINHPLVRDAVKRCADIIEDLSNGKRVSAETAWAAWAEAVAAAEGARAAARSAAWAEAAWAEAAARAAARAAEGAAWAAEGAAWAAAAAAAVAAAWAEAARAAKKQAYVLMADKLLELLKSAPVG